MAKAMITRQPYGNASCEIYGCYNRAPWQITSEGGPLHLVKKLCDHHTRDLFGNLPDELKDALPLPTVEAVVREVQQGTEWGLRLMEALSAALEAPDPASAGTTTKESETALVVEQWTKDGHHSVGVVGENGAVQELYNSRDMGAVPVVVITPVAALVEATAPTGDVDAPYTEVDGKFRCNSCSLEKDTARAIKAHLPYCKGKKESGATE